MPFDLPNAPSNFMQVMNQALHPFIGSFVFIYFDNNLVYSPDVSTHLKHLRKVMSTLHDHKLYANMHTCSFLVSKVIFLRYEVFVDGLHLMIQKFAQS